MPLTLSALDRLGTPLREEAAPFHGVALLENSVQGAPDHERLAGLSAAHPENASSSSGTAGWPAVAATP